MSSVQFQNFARLVGEVVTARTSLDIVRRATFDRNALWNIYLAAIPATENPIFRTNPVHDGAYDRSFIRRYGGLLFFAADGMVRTIWSEVGKEENRELIGFYVDTCRILHEAVVSAAQHSPFSTSDDLWGHTPNFVESLGLTFHHFAARPHRNIRTSHAGKTNGEIDGVATSAARSLAELKLDDAKRVFEMIEARTLQRGSEYRKALQTFIEAKESYEAVDRDPNQVHFLAASFVIREIAAGRNSNHMVQSAYRSMAIRGTVIGKLLIDLADGKPMEEALRIYNSMTDATSFRRSTAVATVSAVERAQNTVDELGLTDSLARRHATIADVSINDVLWADNAAKSHMRGSLMSMLKSAPLAPLNEDVGENATRMLLDTFIKEVMPKAKELSILITKEVTGNFMNITTAANESAPKLFKWDNPFAWSYRGDVADSITERVAHYGGKVDGVMRFSLAWSNADDLDLHCDSPEGHIYYHNRMGVLDLDMNGMDKHSPTDPVENMVWNKTPVDGTYAFRVHQYSQRKLTDVGFEAEFLMGDKHMFFRYDKALSNNTNITVLRVTIENGKVTRFDPGNGVQVQPKGRTQAVWGLTVGQRARVTSVMTSPNYWGGAEEGTAGNKHYFFTLEGAKNTESVRGFYPEQLRGDLHDHRRVFEMLGKEIAVPFSDDQLAGLGFSTTLRRTFVIYADDRPYQITV